jgi:arabinogalactan endo-1,4-beta-galactosidase
MRTRHVTLVLALAFAACAQITAAPPAASTSPAASAPGPKALPFMVGADISSVQAAEARGVRYSDNGVEKDILEILKAHGFNFIRLRTFVDPTKATPRDRPYSAQGFCDMPHTVAMAKRVKAAGMGLLIDFHYSDSWADPGKQFTPSAWKDLPFDALVEKLHDYTKDAVKQMKDAGATPDIVQIGNEITPGMMNDRADGGGSTRNWPQLARLLNAGAAACREVDPSIQIMLHIDKGGNNAVTRAWVDAALRNGVAFDILGESCYTQWQGRSATWQANFADLEKRYPQLKFVIAEVADEVLDAHHIMRDMPEGKGLGTFIWEPTQNGNRQGLFDNRGAVIPAKMAAYDQIAKELKEPRPATPTPLINREPPAARRGGGAAPPVPPAPTP